MNSYPSIFNMGHRAVSELLTVPVNVEEKLDGSQFSFQLSTEGELLIRSKGASMLIDAPEKMFQRAADSVKELRDLLVPGWTYRAEYLAKPKHNTLAYDRIPEKHLMVFDVNTGLESYLAYADKADECHRIGLECVPLIYSGKVESVELFRSFLDRESVLGGQKVEGVVVKPAGYELFGIDKKVLMAKFVSEAFKEAHTGAWKESNPGKNDILALIGATYGVQARWAKAVQHLREAGQLENSPRDIGLIIKEIPDDIEKECGEEIREILWHWAWPHIRRAVTRGMPEWYKNELLKSAFDSEGQ